MQNVSVFCRFAGRSKERRAFMRRYLPELQK